MMLAAAMVGVRLLVGSSRRQLLKSCCRAWKSSVRVLVSVCLRVFASLCVILSDHVRFSSGRLSHGRISVCLS